MGFENLYGVGKGQAQVFDSSEIVNTYARQLQNAGVSRQKEREAYAKELENISWDGAREADEPHFRKQWEAILDLNHKRSLTDKKEDKLSLSSQIQTLKKGLLSDAKRSVNENKTDRDIASMPLTKNRYEMPDNFGDILKARKSTSIFDPSFSNYGTDKFQAQAKPYDVNKNLMELANIAAKEVSVKSVDGKGIDAKYKYNEGKQLDKGAFVTAFLDNIASDDHAKDTYLKGLEPTPENLNDAAESAYAVVENKFALKERDGGYVDPSGRQLSLYERQRQIGEKYEDNDNDSSSGGAISMTIPFGNGGNFTADEYVPISLPKKNFAGSSFIDMKTGKPSSAKLSSSNDYEVVGVLNVPIIKGNTTKDKSLHGSIAQPNFVKDRPDWVQQTPMIHVQYPVPGTTIKKDALIPYNRLQENVKNSKSVKQALSKFKPATGQAKPESSGGFDINSYLKKNGLQ